MVKQCIIIIQNKMQSNGVGGFFEFKKNPDFLQNRDYLM